MSGVNYTYDISQTLPQFFPDGINNAGDVFGSTEAQTNLAYIYDSNSNVVNITAPQGLNLADLEGIDVHGINASGQALVEGYDRAQNVNVAFVDNLQTGTSTPISVPGLMADVVPVVINDAGQIAGTFQDPNAAFNTDAFFYDPATGKTETIDPPGSGPFLLVTGMNNADQIVGEYDDSQNHTHGFIYNAATGLFETINAPNSSGGMTVAGINNEGQVVGSYYDGVNGHGFVYDSSSYTFRTIDVPGAFATGLTGINNSGQVIGEYQDAPGPGDKGFVEDLGTGTISVLDPPGATEVMPEAINDQGEVAGWYRQEYPNDFGFVATKETLPCYCRGTMILTDSGEVAVEQLAIGQKLVTASGAQRPIKWIGQRSYISRYANTNQKVLPICFKAGALAEGIPVRDLWVSPKHAMFIDGVLVPAECLINGSSIVQPETTDRVDYFHIELDSHDVIFANGAPSETFLDLGDRNIFQNASEFAKLYPELEQTRAALCAPRVEDGLVLDAIRRRLAERAGLCIVSPSAPGELRGFVERIEAGVLRGWAQDECFPDAPVCLDVVIDGAILTRVIAGRYRGDLLRAGFGNGQHGFEAALPAVLTTRSIDRLMVRRSSDGAPLRMLSTFSRVMPAQGRLRAA
jgi:YD repeat-containing protein